MAGSVNKVILIGNLGKDPQVRSLNSGEKVVNFSLATSETWRDKATGERKEKTEWHNIVVFNENIGKVVEQYCKKGTKVYVEGQLQTRKWTDQSGVEKYTTEVVLQRFRGELTLLDSRGARRGPRQLRRRRARPELRPRVAGRVEAPGPVGRRRRRSRRRHSVLSGAGPPIPWRGPSPAARRARRPAPLRCGAAVCGGAAVPGREASAEARPTEGRPVSGAEARSTGPPH